MSLGFEPKNGTPDQDVYLIRGARDWFLPAIENIERNKTLCDWGFEFSDSLKFDLATTIAYAYIYDRPDDEKGISLLDKKSRYGFTRDEHTYAVHPQNPEYWDNIERTISVRGFLFADFYTPCQTQFDFMKRRFLSYKPKKTFKQKFFPKLAKTTAFSYKSALKNLRKYSGINSFPIVLLRGKYRSSERIVDFPVLGNSQLYENEVVRTFERNHTLTRYIKSP